MEERNFEDPWHPQWELRLSIAPRKIKKLALQERSRSPYTLIVTHCHTVDRTRYS